jgi:hypothetical protein
MRTEQCPFGARTGRLITRGWFACSLDDLVPGQQAVGATRLCAGRSVYECLGNAKESEEKGLWEESGREQGRGVVRVFYLMGNLLPGEVKARACWKMGAPSGWGEGGSCWDQVGL